MRSSPFTRFAVTCCLLIACAPAAFAQDAAAAADAPGTYENKNHGFKLSYPPELSLLPPPNARGVVLLGTNPEGKGDAFRETVSVNVEAKGQGDKTLKDVSGDFAKSMEKAGIKILEAADEALGGEPARRLLYTHPVKLPDGALAQAKGVIYLALRDGVVYGVEMRATDKTYDKFLPVARKVFETFQWTGPTKAGKE